MKKIIIIALVTFVFFKSQKEKKAQKFSHCLIELISKKDRNELSKLRVYPEKKNLDSESIEYLISNNTSFDLPKLMKKKSLKIRLKKVKNDSIDVFNVVFYDSNFLTLSKSGFLDIGEDKLTEYWGRKYISTELVIQNKEIYFYYTPFFYETGF